MVRRPMGLSPDDSALGAVRRFGEALKGEPVPQIVSDWGGWPADVQSKLRAWNAGFLLSFRQTGTFLCYGCHRAIAPHPYGNALVRPRPKARGSLVCETCLVALARTYETPPPGTERNVATQAERSSYRGALAKAEERERSLRRFLDNERKHSAKLRRQLAIDQIFIDALEALVEPEKLVALRDSLRGQHRRSR